MANKKEKKRAYGDGGVILRDDGRYEGRFMVDGERKSVYGKTENEARKKMREAQRLAQAGRLPDKGGNQLLEKFLEYWIKSLVDVEETTIRTYKFHIKNHITPALGNVKLLKLTAPKVQDFYHDLWKKKKLAATTIQLTHNILTHALSDAEKWGYIGRNPCEHASRPKKEEREIYVLSQVQIKMLLDTIKGTKHECLIILALTTALRKGELLSLHWDDIDMLSKSIRIRRNLAIVDGKRIVKEPKSKKSRRAISLTPFAIEALHAQRTRQIEARLKAETWEIADAVFTTRKGGYLWANRLHEEWKILLSRAGLPGIRFHDLRHNAAAILMYMGVPAKVIQEILGHSSIRITMDIYGHLYPELQQEAMGSMQEFMENIQ